MRKIGLMTVMMILALVAVDITVSIGGDYKDFSWGDDILKVKEKVPDLEERPFAVFFVAVLGAYVVQYGHLYDAEVPNPLLAMTGNIETFHSNESRTTFVFLEGKLMAVAVGFYAENPLPSLEQKYGTVPSKVLVMRGIEYTIRAWFEDKNRIIIHAFTPMGGGGDFGHVTYLDGKVYHKAAEALVQKRNSESKDSLKKID